MSEYPQGVYDDADDDPNRVARAIIEADPTLVVVSDPGNADRYYVAEADQIFVDLSVPGARDQFGDLQARAAEFVDERMHCEPYTVDEWCRRHPTHDWDMVEGYLGHLGRDLQLEIGDISALRPADPNFVRNLILTQARGDSQVPSPFLPITVYTGTVWSPHPYGPPFPIRQPPNLGGPIAHHAGHTRVAVLDAGLPTNYATLHPYLTGVAESGFGVEDPYVTPGHLREGAGHGLFIMDIIYRRCHRAAPVLMPDVTRNANGLTMSDSTIPMILHDLATRFAQRGEGQLVVDMSFTADLPGGVEPMKTLLALELQHLVEQGLDVLCVAAAGNDGQTAPRYPAAYSQNMTNVVSVGALNTGTSWVAGFSNRGPWVQGWAGGTGVEAAYLPGVYPSTPVAATFPVDPGTESWARWQGTSFAVPRVVAAIACQAHVGEESLLQAWHALRGTEHPFVNATPEKGTIINVP